VLVCVAMPDVQCHPAREEPKFEFYHPVVVVAAAAAAAAAVPLVFVVERYVS